MYMTERELLRLFSNNIKGYRVRHNWSQAELAERVNISVNFLSDIENSRKWASPITMVKFSKVFGIDVYELLKPAKGLPDDSGALLSVYTNDIQKIVSQVIEEVQTAYTERLAELGKAAEAGKNK
jgi:transcriptional regulator with XRE-family HTH domain